MQRLVLTLVISLSIGLLACPKPKTSPPDSGQPDSGSPTDAGLGDGTLGHISTAANGNTFSSPFDATPSPDGTKVYFTALSGTDPSVYSASAAGGGVTSLASGAPLIAPFGITINGAGTQLYVSDSAGTESATDDSGAIFSLSTAGGTPTAVSGSTGYQPKGVVLKPGATETLYFTGIDPANQKPGAFSLPAAGGSVAVVAEGAPFLDPSGIAVSSQGNVYVLDTVADGTGLATAFQIVSGSPTVLASGLRVGYPAGIALSQDESVVLVSGLDPVTRTDVVYRIVIQSHAMTQSNNGIGAFVESAGLHRAQNAEIYSFVDSAANQSGTVFVLTP